MFGQTGIVKFHYTLQEISVKLNKRIPTVLRKRFYLLGNRFYGFFSRGLAPITLRVNFCLS